MGGGSRAGMDAGSVISRLGNSDGGGHRPGSSGVGGEGSGGRWPEAEFPSRGGGQWPPASTFLKRYLSLSFFHLFFSFLDSYGNTTARMLRIAALIPNDKTLKFYRRSDTK